MIKPTNRILTILKNSNIQVIYKMKQILIYLIQYITIYLVIY